MGDERATRSGRKGRSRSVVIREDVAVLEFARPGVVVVDSLFTPPELEDIAEEMSALSFDAQDLGRGVIGRRERAATESPDLAGLIWDRLAPVLPPVRAFFSGGPGTPVLDPPLNRWEAVGCNAMLRVYRYGLGASFSEHEDEPWRPDERHRTMLTVLIYLPCGGCEGGETVIDGHVVPVVDGRTVVFDHGLLHEGRPVERGNKVTLRSDVIARAV
jgi:hypothetical protein